MKFFNIDLHISIIADMIKIFNDLGHEITEQSLSNHTWVFNKQRANIPILDNNRWSSLSPKQLSDEFYQNYKNDLNDYDGFIVTYPPPFSLLYKHFDKPIIINNPIRYEWPFSFRQKDWEYFNDYLKDGVDTGKIILVANNVFDKNYMEHFLDREVQHIPSICDYYGQYYSPKSNNFIYYSRGEINEIKLQSIIHKDKLFNTHKHNDLLGFKGIVHFPYQISYMSIFEQYTANVPLFLPSKDFLIELYKKGRNGILKEVSWNNLMNNHSGSFVEYKHNFDPNNYKDIDSVRHWLEYADFYDNEWMPHIQFFNSFEELEKLTIEVDTEEVSRKMKNFNKIRKEKIYKMWDDLLKTKIK